MVDNLVTDIRRCLAYVADELGDVKAELFHRRQLRIAIKAGFNISQLRDVLGRWATQGGLSVETSDGFLTGIASIDQTSQNLSDTLVQVMSSLEYLPTMNPSVYGTLVHIAFGASVRSQDLPGVGDIERSFSLDDADPYYGMAGTVRTDVTLRNILGEIIAIYDVKTGDRKMSGNRAAELRQKTGAAPNTPVFELNIVRGITRKSRGIAIRRYACVILHRVA